MSNYQIKESESFNLNQKIKRINTSPTKEEPSFRKLNIQNLKSNINKPNLHLNFFSNLLSEKKPKYKGRNYKGALSIGLSNIFSKISRDKPIGIFNTNSSSNSLTITNNNSSRPHSHSFHHKTNNSPIFWDLKRNKTYRQGTINTFISTSETDMQKDYSFENISGDKNMRKVYKTQLSKISENPKNKTVYNEKNNTDLTIISYNSINNTLKNNSSNNNNFNINLNINDVQYKKKLYSPITKNIKNSLFNNNVLLNRSMKNRLLTENLSRNLTKKLTNYNTYLNKESNISDNSPSDTPFDIKKIRLKEVCKKLIEKNKAKQIEIKNKKYKFLSKFNFYDSNKFRLNTLKTNIIRNHVTNLKEIIKKKLKEKNFILEEKKKTLMQYKNKILISLKVEKRELLVIKYVIKLFKKIKKKYTNIINFNYALELSEKYFHLTLNPKTISLRLEKDLSSKLIDNFTLNRNHKRSSAYYHLIIKSDTFLQRSFGKKLSEPININIITITKKSLKFINRFLIIDYHSAILKFCNKIENKVNIIKKLFKSQKSSKKKTYFKKKTMKNKNEVKNYDRPIFSKNFYFRKDFKQTMISKKKTEMTPISTISLSQEMRKNNIYLFTDSLINNKEHTLLRTIEIKSILESKLQDELEKLIYSIKDLNFPLFKKIFEQYTVSPNLHDQKGNTLLSLAVQSNCFQIVNFLLHSGADPNLSNVTIILYNIF